MEPITYANGSTLEDPAITYGIVFSNFMSKGVFTFEGGTDRLIQLMHRRTAAATESTCASAATSSDPGGARARWRACEVNGRDTIGRRDLQRQSADDLQPGRRGALRPHFVDEARAVRLNNSSTQVYMALKPDEQIDESTGDLLFSSTARVSAPICC
jgi:hypothetical protein